MQTQRLRKMVSSWKNAMEKKKAFQKHESSDSHMEKQGFLSDLITHIARFPDRTIQASPSVVAIGTALRVIGPIYTRDG